MSPIFVYSLFYFSDLAGRLSNSRCKCQLCSRSLLRHRTYSFACLDDVIVGAILTCSSVYPPCFCSRCQPSLPSRGIPRRALLRSAPFPASMAQKCLGLPASLFRADFAQSAWASRCLGCCTNGCLHPRGRLPVVPLLLSQMRPRLAPSCTHPLTLTVPSSAQSTCTTSALLPSSSFSARGKLIVAAEAATAAKVRRKDTNQPDE